MQDVKSKLGRQVPSGTFCFRVCEFHGGYLLLGGVAHLSESAGQLVFVQAPCWDSVVGIIGTLLQRFLGKQFTVAGANTR